jgi:hypothetical protein
LNVRGRPHDDRACRKGIENYCTFSLDELAPGAPARLVEAAHRLEEFEDVRVLTELVSSPAS